MSVIEEARAWLAGLHSRDVERSGARAVVAGLLALADKAAAVANAAEAQMVEANARAEMAESALCRAITRDPQAHPLSPYVKVLGERDEARATLMQVAKATDQGNVLRIVAEFLAFTDADWATTRAAEKSTPDWDRQSWVDHVRRRHAEEKAGTP